MQATARAAAEREIQRQPAELVVGIENFGNATLGPDDQGQAQLDYVSQPPRLVAAGACETQQRSETMTTEQMYDGLLSRGWHEDDLDEMSPAELQDTYDSGVRGDETEN